VSQITEQVSDFGHLPVIAIEELEADSSGNEELEPSVPASLALLQYTSGSTGRPKGVCISNENLIHNASLVAKAMGFDAESVGVNWLPLYHDMGLMSGVVAPLSPATLLSPNGFLAQPLTWFEAITRYKARELCISGCSVSRGYWNNAEETNRTFCERICLEQPERFLRSSDLGFQYDGNLFVVGRLKDVIITRGLNHYAEDVEATIDGCHTALITGAVAAFSIESAGAERLVVVLELKRTWRTDTKPVLETIVHEVLGEHAIEPYAIILIRQGTLLRTTSGKARRPTAPPPRPPCHRDRSRPELGDQSKPMVVPHLTSRSPREFLSWKRLRAATVQWRSLALYRNTARIDATDRTLAPARQRTH
jgi:acyl-CoA synthetase (AMP-forming)/AMP-acid ligase II